MAPGQLRLTVGLLGVLSFSLLLAASHGATVFSKPESRTFSYTAEESTRTVVSFDYGWRFRHGHAADGAPGPGGLGFSDIANHSCTNMEHNPNRFTAGDCMMGCAYNRDCFVWQQDGQKHCQHGGKSAECTPAEKGALLFGGQRTSAAPARTDYKCAQSAFSDADWQVIDVPHDFVVAGDFEDMADTHHGYLPRNVSWYRKHFHVPSTWRGSHVDVHFEGVFHVAQVWLNGQHLYMHTDGYTGFTVRLDNVTGLEYGTAAENVLAVRADATFGSGHWYEGGGIYRRTHLSRSNHTHFTHDGIFVSPEVTALTASKVRVHASAELETTVAHGIDASAASPSTAMVIFTLLDDATGAVLAANRSAKIRLSPGSTPQIVSVAMDVAGIALWSVQQPTLYTVQVQLAYNTDSPTATVVDAQNVTAGFRQTAWSSAGLRLNAAHFKLRGFSHHNSFAGVGVAMPDRVHLFRAQASRALGGSFWRMSHNPYAPALYDLLDALGVPTWDENRDYAPEYAPAMHDMVKRDRHHPSVLVWSFCNEYECLQVSNATGLAFRAVAKALDPQRPTVANGDTVGLDVQGKSHAGNNSFEKFHEQYPAVPLVLSECCSCQTQRLDRIETTTCMHDQNSPGLLPYVAGSLGVWTLFDYYGESHVWPSVTSSFGNFDLAGFPKPHAYWYVLNWLNMIDAGDQGRPPVPVKPVTRVLDLPAFVSGTVAVLSSGAAVEVYADGKSLGRQASTGTGEPLVFALASDCSFPQNLSDVQCHGLHKNTATSVKLCAAACCADRLCTAWQWGGDKGCFIGALKPDSCKHSASAWAGAGRSAAPTVAIGNITAVSYGSRGGDDVIVGTHTVLRGGKAVAVKLELDAPSPSTGTGSRLVLDGHDAALVRASVVDGDGILLANASHNITFAVTTGPGRLIGVGNGDNACHRNAKSSAVPAYGSLARAVFQVTLDCVGRNLDVVTAVDVDHGPATVQPSGCPADGDALSMVVHASSDGLEAATLTIPLSTSRDDLPLPVARASVGLQDYSYLTEFVG